MDNLEIKNIHHRIRLDESDIPPPECLKEGLDTIHCRGNITVEDFTPRKFSFSFGFHCSEINPGASLKGLAYKISIHEPTDKIKCISLPRKVNDLCSQFYQHGLLPNLVGAEDVATVVRHWEPYIAAVAILERLCYQHMSETACYAVMPKCDSVSRQIIHPCREMCHDFRVACSNIVLTKNALTGAFVSSSDKNFTLDATTAVLDCDYLPSLGGDIPCFYKPVTCRSPPSAENAAVFKYFCEL